MTNKQIILERMKASLAKFEESMGVQCQMNAAIMYGLIEYFETITEAEATSTIEAIIEAEASQKEGAIKYGWPISPVDPINYLQFSECTKELANAIYNI